ncbi:MAG: crosslink repair DNA glycosylase YcaQ family protein [Nakamurella sp.]
MALTWSSALTWRLRRHRLDDNGADSIEAVVNRLVAVPSWSGDARTAIRLRLDEAADPDVDAAIAQGRIFGTYAFRGTSHLMTPASAAVHLALRSAGRQWELPSWRTHYGLEPEDWPRLRATVREALRDGPLTQHELALAVTKDPAYQHLSDAFDSRSHTLLKPLGWQGDLCFSPGEGATFRSMESIPGWTGVAELEDAGPRAVRAYLACYGPATVDRLQYWLGEGLSAGRKRISRWIAGLGDALIELVVDGETTLCLAEHEEEIRTAEPSDAVVLLQGSDQWVLGAGTSDQHVVPAEHRASVTRGANLVLVGGRVSGTWTVKGTALRIDWFGAEPSRSAMDAAIERLSQAMGRDLVPPDA